MYSVFTLNLVPPELDMCKCRWSLLFNSQVACTTSTVSLTRQSALQSTISVQNTDSNPDPSPPHHAHFAYLCIFAVPGLRGTPSHTCERTEHPRGKTGLHRGCTCLVGDTEGSVDHTLKITHKELSSTPLPMASCTVL